MNFRPKKIWVAGIFRMAVPGSIGRAGIGSGLSTPSVEWENPGGFPAFFRDLPEIFWNFQLLTGKFSVLKLSRRKIPRPTPRSGLRDLEAIERTYHYPIRSILKKKPCCNHSNFPERSSRVPLRQINPYARKSHPVKIPDDTGYSGPDLSSDHLTFPVGRHLFPENRH